MTEGGPGGEREAGHWPAYNAAQVGRPARELVLRAIELAGTDPVAARRAVDLGCGAGVETSALLAAGFDVLAIDPAPGTADLLGARAPASDAGPDTRVPRLEVRVTGFENLGDLPASDLVYSGFALPYASPDVFARVWADVRACLRPGAILAVDLFGDRDEWAGTPGETYVARTEVEELLEGLEVLWFEEEDADGPCFSGTKHWHVFHVVARRPGAFAPTGAGRDERPASDL